MDYIKKMIGKICKTKDNPETTDAVKSREINTANSPFRGFMKNATALTACGLAVVVVAAAVDTGAAGAEVAETVEESSSEDGSAPGRYLAAQNVVEEVQSDIIISDIKEDKLTENITENITENVTENVTENPTVEETTQESTASAVENEQQIVAEPNYVLDFTEEDYKVLCTIVEAEAGDQDEKGKILVANVIINRAKSGRFPTTITGVVFQHSGSTYQFSPTKPGGRYYYVTATESTISCVDRALKGEDYSQGALYFTMKTSAGSWFNTCLEFLFQHGDHYFYK